MKNCQGRITINRKNNGGSDNIDISILDSDGWYKLFMNKLLEDKITISLVRTLWPIVHGYEGAKLVMETDEFKIDLKLREVK